MAANTQTSLEDATKAFHERIYQQLMRTSPAEYGQIIENLIRPRAEAQKIVKGSYLPLQNGKAMASSISDFLAGKGMDVSVDEKGKGFEEKLALSMYSRNIRIPNEIECGPLQQIQYGRGWAESMPKGIFVAMQDPFLATYFLAGITLSKINPEIPNIPTWYVEDAVIKDWSAARIVGEMVERGVVRLNKYQRALKKKLPHRKQAEQAAAYLKDMTILSRRKRAGKENQMSFL